MSITLVTAFYDLTRYETRPLDRTKENYLSWGEFVLGLDIDLVLFVDKETSTYVSKKRRQFGLLDRTLVVCREYDDLPWTVRNTDIQKYLDENEVDYKNSFKNGAAYHTLTWNKLYMVEEAISTNPFNAEFFGWIDFGIYRVVRNYLPARLNEDFFVPADKRVNMMELEWTSDKELEDLQKFSSAIRFKMPAGFWTGHVTYLTRFSSLFKEYLYTLLSQRIVVLEEMIFAIIYNRHQEMFRSFYGNYYHLLANYRETNIVPDTILRNISHGIRQESWAHVDTVCSNIYEEAYHVMTPEQRFTLFDKWSYSSYYYNRDMSQKHVELWLNRLEKEPEQIKLLKKHKERIIKNMSYYEKGDAFIQRVTRLL